MTELTITVRNPLTITVRNPLSEEAKSVSKEGWKTALTEPESADRAVDDTIRFALGRTMRRTSALNHMNPILGELDASDRRLLRRRAMPAFTPVMLATLAKHAFSDPAWVFEAKLDGQRSLLWRRRSSVRLITRNEKDRTSHYPDLVEPSFGTTPLR